MCWNGNNSGSNMRMETVVLVLHELLVKSAVIVCVFMRVPPVVVYVRRFVNCRWLLNGTAFPSLP